MRTQHERMFSLQRPWRLTLCDESTSIATRLRGAKPGRHPGIDGRLVDITSALVKPSAKAPLTNKTTIGEAASRGATAQRGPFGERSKYGNLHTSVQGYRTDSTGGGAMIPITFGPLCATSVPDFAVSIVRRVNLVHVIRKEI